MIRVHQATFLLLERLGVRGLIDGEKDSVEGLNVKSGQRRDAAMRWKPGLESGHGTEVEL